MPKYKKNLLNPNLYGQFQSPSDRYKFTNAQLMDGFYNQAMATATDGRFDAYCLSGIRTEDNTGAGTDPNDAYLDPFGYIWIVVYPDTNIARPADPRVFADPKDIVDSIGGFKSAGFWVRSSYLAHGKAAPAFGQKVSMYFEEGSIANSDWSKARFIEPVGQPDYGDYSFLKLASVQGTVTAQDAFSGGAATLMGVITDDGDIYTRAQKLRDQGVKIRGRASPTANSGDKELADKAGIPVNVLRAFRSIESGPLGPTAIRFEPHLWYRKTRTDPPKGFTRNNEVGYSKVASETNRAAFLAAYAVNQKVAVTSTSFGLYQVLGGKGIKAYGSAATFWEAFGNDATKASDEMLVAWFKDNPKAVQAANALDFTKLAENYNGSQQAKHYYDALIAEAYVIAQQKFQ